MMYVFAVLIGVTLLLSVFSVDEISQAAGSLLGAAEGDTLTGRVLLMLLIVVVLVLLIAYKVRKKHRMEKP